MANKTKNAPKNDKKQKGENKKKRVPTEYQRTRDAMKKQKRRKNGRVADV